LPVTFNESFAVSERYDDMIVQPQGVAVGGRVVGSGLRFIR